MDKDGGVLAGAVDDMGENMQCSNHPYKTNPGGICAFCLQEKLGKLLTSSQSNASFFPSSASPSFRSDIGGVNGGLSFAGTSSSSSIPSSSASSAKKKLKKVVASNNHINNGTSLVLMRSKSSSSGPAPIRRHHHHHHHLFDGVEYTPRKGGFWSFLHISSRKHSRDHKVKGESKPSVHPTTINTTHTPAAKEKSVGVGAGESSSRKGDYGDENESPNSSHASSSSFGRKVARSRSVGCGSRSFSGDLLERISTGFGDCTLRRVESQREAKQPKGVGIRGRGGMGMGEHHHRIKERVKCGGIFGGFSSSSSSSSYWASSSEEVNQGNGDRRDVGIEHRSNSMQPHPRHKSWGWAFASPMRAFKSSKPDEKNAANGNAATNNANAPTPNLAAIPSLLTVRS
ncbi:hypothetical protein ACHQM5_006295 [Ranunculus cassubicifolius]